MTHISHDCWQTLVGRCGDPYPLKGGDPTLLGCIANCYVSTDMAGGVTSALGVGIEFFPLCGKGHPSRWSYCCTVVWVDRPMHRLLGTFRCQGWRIVLLASDARLLVYVSGQVWVSECLI